MKTMERKTTWITREDLVEQARKDILRWLYDWTKKGPEMFCSAGGVVRHGLKEGAEYGSVRESELDLILQPYVDSKLIERGFVARVVEAGLDVPERTHNSYRIYRANLSKYEEIESVLGKSSL